jgi:hypothetical protein
MHQETFALIGCLGLEVSEARYTLSSVITGAESTAYALDSKAIPCNA